MILHTHCYAKFYSLKNIQIKDINAIYSIRIYRAKYNF